MGGAGGADHHQIMGSCSLLCSLSCLLVASSHLASGQINPAEKCGCAKPGSTCEHDGRQFPKPGFTRSGYCTNYEGSDPNGGDTHKVCATVSRNLNDWFASVGNDLSSVVYPGDGWCLCKHWTRGTLCCKDEATKYLTSTDFDWNASLTADIEVFEIQQYIAAPSAAGRDALCTTGALSGCTYRTLTAEQKSAAATVKAEWKTKYDGAATNAHPPSAGEDSSSSTALIVGLSIGAVALIGGIVVGLVLAQRRRSREAKSEV